jgi:hypothetical protein
MLESLTNSLLGGLFSGIGNSIVKTIHSKFSGKRATTHPCMTSNELKSEKIKTKENASTRLKQCINDITNNNHKIDEIADFLGFLKASELENRMNGIIEPEFSELDEISDKLGLSREWLKYGKGPRFHIDINNLPYAIDYIERTNQLSPTTIYFLKSKNPECEAGILLKINKIKYIAFPRTWHISSVVGSTGSQQILSFIEYVEKVTDIIERPCNSFIGNVLKAEHFNDIFTGKVYPDKYLSSFNTPWWEDLCDIYHKYPISKNYEKRYGHEFIQAQEIARDVDRKRKEQNIPKEHSPH